MSSFFRKPILTVLSWFARDVGNRAAILMYHSVDTNGRFFSVKPKDFERQMNYLAEKKFKVVPLSEIVQKVREKKLLHGEVAITFDDGYRDVYTSALPVLKKHKFPATVFLITGMLGKDGPVPKRGKSLPVMSKDEVKSMIESGLIEFMPHTVSHPELPKISHNEAIREIEDARHAVEVMTKSPADILAYPKGEYTREILIHLKRNDVWLGAVTTEAGLVGKGDDVFRLKRLPVDSATTFSVFKALLSDAIEKYEKLKGK